METDLRPMTLGEILDRTAQLYRTNFLLFAGIFAVYSGVALALNLLTLGLMELLKRLHMNSVLVWTTLGSTLAELLILFLLFGAAVAAICRAVASLHLGERTTIRGAYQSILPHLRRYVWLMAITAVAVWAPIALLYSGYLGTMIWYTKGAASQAAGHLAEANPAALSIFATATVIFILLLIPVGAYTIWMGLRYALALPACVVEDLKAVKALRRGVDLSKSARGRIFVLALLIGAVKIGLTLITQSFIFVAVVKQHGQAGPGLTALSHVISFFTTTFLGPIYATGITLLYYDQRVRKEGYDIEWMMQAAGLTLPPPSGELDGTGREPEQGSEMA
ncbi:MAG: hypothetical protein ACLGRW_05405 [Acidobacteriota bacterium]|jgi:hypothetical protein